MDPLERLNPRQREAALHKDGYALVLAGPGTGKTTTMVGRYAWLLKEGVQPDDILVATFSNKGAAEMRKRISDLTGLDLTKQAVGTFHSICFRMLGAPRMVTPKQRFEIAKSVAPQWKGEYQDLLDSISLWKDTLVAPDQAGKLVASASSSERASAQAAALAYPAYQRALKNQGLHDFGDLIIGAIQRLRRERKGSVSRPSWRYVMVDEYQDINPAQYTLIAELTSGHSNLWVVGDDDQSIYGWRGSDIRYITKFKSRRPDASVYRLEDNYRSTPVILRTSRSLIEHNKKRLSKPLTPTRGGRSPICFHAGRDAWAEARWVVDTIGELLTAKADGDVAILVRTNNQTVGFEGRLNQKGIPYQLQGAGGFWTVSPVGSVMAGLARLEGQTPTWRGPSYLQEPLDQVLKQAGSPGKKLRSAAELLEEKAPSSMSKEKKQEWVTGAHQLADMAENFATVSSFLEYAAQQRSAGQGSNERARVTVSTIHQAKGLEWDTVFVCGCEEGLLPHASNEDIAEERRLAFVAATRARNYLIFSWAESRDQSPTRRSRFVQEARDALEPSQIDDRRSNAGARPLSPKKTESKRRRSARGASSEQRGSAKSKTICVEHPEYGVGKVISISIGSETYHIDFRRYGIKEVPGRSVSLVRGPC
jgi:DNA helicase II / ATP-dependent DNA helicase PcrA